jgi:hypothetical protein
MKDGKKTRGENEEMAREYDLRGKKGVRGKYFRAYRRGRTVSIHQEDGTVTEEHFARILNP